jgi:hypothetical protein
MRLIAEAAAATFSQASGSTTLLEVFKSCVSSAAACDCLGNTGCCRLPARSRCLRCLGHAVVAWCLLHFRCQASRRGPHRYLHESGRLPSCLRAFGWQATAGWQVPEQLHTGAFDAFTYVPKAHAAHHLGSFF